MAKRGEIKNISKVLEDVISQKHFKVGIDNLRVQEAWVKFATTPESKELLESHLAFLRGIGAMK